MGKLRKRLGEEMALEVIRAQEAKQPVPGPRCPTCQQEMRYKGQKETTVESNDPYSSSDNMLIRAFPPIRGSDQCFPIDEALCLEHT